MSHNYWLEHMTKLTRPQKTMQFDAQSVGHAMVWLKVPLYLPPKLSPSKVDCISLRYHLLIGTEQKIIIYSNSSNSRVEQWNKPTYWGFLAKHDFDLGNNFVCFLTHLMKRSFMKSTFPFCFTNMNISRIKSFFDEILSTFASATRLRFQTQHISFSIKDMPFDSLTKFDLTNIS